MNARCWDCGGEDAPCFCCRCRDRWPLLTVVSLKEQSQILAHEETLHEETRRELEAEEESSARYVVTSSLQIHDARQEADRLRLDLAQRDREVSALKAHVAALELRVHLTKEAINGEPH